MLPHGLGAATPPTMSPRAVTIPIAWRRLPPGATLRVLPSGTVCCTLPLSVAERAERSEICHRITRRLWALTERGRTRGERLTATQRMERRDRARIQMATKNNHAPPPLEADCPPRPADGRCQCCGRRAARLVLDHDHKLFGDFLGWCCDSCNNLGDDVARLEARVAYLRSRGFTEKSW